MMWQTPKTYWKPTDTVSPNDYNRWKNNLVCVKELATKLYGDFSTVVLYDDSDYTNYPLSDRVNALEQVLEAINLNTYNFDIGSTKTYSVNGFTLDYNEMNRIEKMTLRLYATLFMEQGSAPRLSFRLGSRPFNVYRNQHIVSEEMAHRLQFILGSEKGVYYERP